MDRRLLRETSFGLTAKLWQINWLYILLLCALAGVGYTALYSAAGGSPEPYADRHVMRFAAGLVLMVGVALVDIRVIQKLAWPIYAVCLALLVVVEHGNAGAQMAGPIARDIMTDALQRDPANRTEPLPQQVAEKER